MYYYHTCSTRNILLAIQLVVNIMHKRCTCIAKIQIMAYERCKINTSLEQSHNIDYYVVTLIKQPGILCTTLIQFMQVNSKILLMLLPF